LQVPAEAEDPFAFVLAVFAAPVRAAVFGVPVGVTSQTPLIVSTAVSAGSRDPGSSDEVFGELEALPGVALCLGAVGGEDGVLGFEVPDGVCPNPNEAPASKIMQNKGN